MIAPAMLMIPKVLAVMINKRINLCIFAALPRGSGLRRGTTCERLEVDKGRHLRACIFDLCRTPQGIAPFYFFLVLFRLIFGFPLGSTSVVVR